MTLTCILVDDEEPARKRLQDLLENCGEPVEVAGEYGTAKTAVSAINKMKPDVVFLDINMPVLNGFDVVDLLVRPRPHIIFVTAYDEFAVKAFEVHALDYLTKPVKLERLSQSLKRITAQYRHAADDRLDQALKATRPLNRITLRKASRYVVMDVRDIHYFEADDKLVYAFAGAERYRVEQTVEILEQRLDPEHFIRIHRSVIVNSAAIRALEPWFNYRWRVVLTTGDKLQVAKRRVSEVKSLLGMV